MVAIQQAGMRPEIVAQRCRSPEAGRRPMHRTAVQALILAQSLGIRSSALRIERGIKGIKDQESEGTGR